MTGETARDLMLHGGVLVALAGLAFVLPEYHHGNLARIMVLAVFAMGYNLAFGYTGLLSLGHAMFFAAGLYSAGLTVVQWEWTALAGFGAGIVAAATLALAVGVLALRTTGVSFMIVTLMFAQAVYLTVLYYGEITRGDEGFVIPQAARSVAGLDLSAADTRFWAAFALFTVAIVVLLAVVRAPIGRVMVAVRENEERVRMLGYDPFRVKLTSLVISGAMAGAAGAAYALLFGYAGATFSSIQYSILPLLWVLVGGPGTVLGAFLGTLLMFYLIDLASSDVMPWMAAQAETFIGLDARGLASAHMILVGAALVILVLYAPRGLLGVVRARWARWLA
ncbi:MAG: branched-chain amino acid ABC transporter permease [Pseudomonadota bacterium]